jgi:release factor glutamine methyltransferase
MSALNRQPLRVAVLEAERILTAAGVPSPRVDAELLAEHVVGVPRGNLPMVPLVDSSVIETYRGLVNRRAERIPLQHLVGVAGFGPVTLAVGKGVFVPRPETELLLEWGLAAVADVRAPRVVDLCTGSGALALGVAASRPDAEVHAVESEPAALAWARRNIDANGGTVQLHAADVTRNDVLVQLEASVDLVLCNPPYVPTGPADGESEELPAEVADHEPAVALFAGPNGLAVIRPVVSLAAGLLRVGGSLAIEHHESHAGALLELMGRRRVLGEVTDHNDLADRPRFVTARRRLAE